MNEKFRTQAEFARLVAEEVVRRMGNESGAKPPRGAGAYTEIANRDGHCKICGDHEKPLAQGFIPIGISARHLHLTSEQVEILFGKGHQLTPMKELSQPGQFAAQETVSIVGKRGRAIERVRILGPVRSAGQVEVSLTDCIQLGTIAPVRASGDHHETPGILLVGPKGHLALESGLIRANRHMHLQPSEAAALALRDNDIVAVKIDGDRPAIFFDVQVRVHPNFRAELHLDTDDANAVGLGDGAVAKIIKT